MDQETTTPVVGVERPDARARKLYRPTLSLIMIVKNEAKNLPELLTPLKDKFDEIVVVDTGSDDGTPEIAESLGARVHHFEWINDFSAARNESIRHATGDWLFWLDGDDRMRPDEVDNVRQLVTLHPDRDVAYYCHLRSLGKSWSSDQNLLQVRLFPRIPGAEFVGEVHERVGDSLRKLGVKLLSSPIEVIHTGYMDESALPEKYERNFTILHRVLEQDPTDVHARYQLVMQLGAMNRREEALREVDLLGEHVKKLAEKFPDGVHRYLTLRGVVYRNFGEREVAQQCFEELVEKHPKMGVGHYLLGAVYHDLQEWDAMRSELLKAEYHGIAIESLPIPLARVYFDISSMLAVYYRREEKWIRAAQEFRKALAVQEDYLPYYAEMGDAFYRAGDLQRAWTAYRTGIRVHDLVVERFRERDPERLESGTARTGTILELSPDARSECLSRMYAAAVGVEIEQNRLPAAKTMLDEAISRFPDASNLAVLSLDLALRTGRIRNANDTTARCLDLGGDSYTIFESVINLHLRHQRLAEAAPLAIRFWRRHPQKWDAALIGVLASLHTGQLPAANEVAREMRGHLVEAGLPSAADWPSEWTSDHPALDVFRDVAFWSQRPTGVPDEPADGADRDDRRQTNAHKLAAICESISTKLAETPGLPVAGGPKLDDGDRDSGPRS